MSGPGDSEEQRRTGAQELQKRVAYLRSFGGLRRTLRVTEEIEEIAASAQRFAVDVLDCTHAAIYGADKEDGDFQLLSSSVGPVDLPPMIERTSRLASELESSAAVRGDALTEIGAVGSRDAVALALRASPTQMIGVAIVLGDVLDSELLDEFVFDVESALAARMIGRLRAEELAVLEIQERELVGLLREVEARDAIIQRDLEEARQFQRQMLGPPPRVPGAAIEIIYKPLGLVGGDLYAVSVDGTRLRLFVADATGHGVRASLTTMFIKSVYEAVRLTAPDPAALLAALNETIARTYKSSEMLFSAACVDLDLTTGRVCCASAAHPAICVVRSGEATFIEGSGAFLGLRAGIKFTTSETSIAHGDGLYLYTDGFVEARKQNQLFGDERLMATVRDAHMSGMLAGEAIVAAVTAFLDGTPLDDDSTIIGVRYGTEDVVPFSQR